MKTARPPDPQWSRRRPKTAPPRAANAFADGMVLPTADIVDALQALIAPGDRVALEGNNQKQADFLSRSLGQVDPAEVHDLHLIIPSVSRPEHLDLFERGIARKLDFAYAGPQSLRISQFLEDGMLEIGAIHTYIELYARLYVDLTPNVALVAGSRPTAQGNLYTGPNTEDTPTHRRSRRLPRRHRDRAGQRDRRRSCRASTSPASWVDFVVAGRQAVLRRAAVHARSAPRSADVQVLMAMMVIRGIYERHQVQSLNHGIGFNTAAIELLLPTYGEQLGLKGKICRHWTLNPHPTLIPAIESGWVESVHCFGGEVGMEALRRGAPRRLLHRPRRLAALEPRAVPARRASMRSTCSSARRCRWMATATRRRSRAGGWPASAAPRTWATTRTAAAMRRPPGSTCCNDRQPAGARPQARGADGRDVPGGRQADLRRLARRGARSAQEPACRSRR